MNPVNQSRLYPLVVHRPATNWQCVREGESPSGIRHEQATPRWTAGFADRRRPGRDRRRKWDHRGPFEMRGGRDRRRDGGIDTEA